MCTVVTRWMPAEPVRILAIRDEFVSRDFDSPGAWWPAQPNIVGGRDRRAGGSWCVSDAATGVTALVLNRPERQTGTPSRGVLPLAAVAAGARWTDEVDHRQMASFTLVLAGPSGVTAWTWDAEALRRHDLEHGTHVFTSRAFDADDVKTKRLTPLFASRPWLDVVTEQLPSDDRTALIVRHPFETDTYATVFGQLITATPGELSISYSRTPWEAASWVDDSWRSQDVAPGLSQ
ncbi:MAG TPA: NRDE family protein [Jatrophihabitans sp.]|nr:NRDE family protein [Jatrophihabitans sp.]